MSRSLSHLHGQRCRPVGIPRSPRVQWAVRSRRMRRAWQRRRRRRGQRRREATPGASSSSTRWASHRRVALTAQLLRGVALKSPECEARRLIRQRSFGQSHTSYDPAALDPVAAATSGYCMASTCPTRAAGIRNQSCICGEDGNAQTRMSIDGARLLLTSGPVSSVTAPSSPRSARFFKASTSARSAAVASACALTDSARDARRR